MKTIKFSKREKSAQIKTIHKPFLLCTKKTEENRVESMHFSKMSTKKVFWKSKRAKKMLGYAVLIYLQD